MNKKPPHRNSRNRRKEARTPSHRRARDRSEGDANDMFGYLPSDTKLIVRRNLIHNLTLAAEKFIIPRFEDKALKLRREDSLALMRNCIGIATQLALKCRQRQEQTIEMLCSSHLSSEFALTSRMIVGLGQASVYETSLTLHHLYGFPYIPSSAIKGVTRRGAILEEFENDENEALKDRTFQRVFGYHEDGSGRMGEIIFFDAIPKKFDLELDVMTPHFPEYYKEKEPPTEDQNPNPLIFLTVDSGSFAFRIGVSKHSKKRNGNDLPVVLEKARKWLEAALTIHGIGGKTALGYGLFKEA